jgi:hypothetical protein
MVLNAVGETETPGYNRACNVYNMKEQLISILNMREGRDNRWIKNERVVSKPALPAMSQMKLIIITRRHEPTLRCRTREGLVSMMD